MLASSVAKRQPTGAPWALRSDTQAATPVATVAPSGIRRSMR